MRRDTQGALVLCLGVIAIRLVLNEQFLSFVKDAMRIPLLVSGGILVVLGLSLLLGGDAPPEHHDEHPDGHNHDHSRGPVVGWLLLVPVLVLLLVAPAPLGSAALDQRGGRPPVAGDVGTTTFPPLPAPVDGAVELTLPDLVNRARFDPEAALDGVTVRVTGFAAADPDGPGDTFRLSRFQIACCAADALPWQVRVLSVPGDVPPPDQWVDVTGVLVPTDGPTDLGDDPPLVELTASAIDPVDAPVDPYL